jgi:hypothetical protein
MQVEMKSELMGHSLRIFLVLGLLLLAGTTQAKTIR